MMDSGDNQHRSDVERFVVGSDAWFHERVVGLSWDIIGMADFHGRFIRVNDAVTRILGISPAEFTSRPILEMIHPDDRERTASEQLSLRAGGLETLHFRNRFVTSDGGYRWIEWSARADVDAQVTIVIGRDVTEEQDTRETMLRHERTLSRLLVRRSQERDEARIETLRRLALAAEFHDDGTAGHTERVGFTAHLIACELGTDPDWTATLRHAAPLHDVGKVAIADSILRKPGP